MARYLISFDDGAMDAVPEGELPAVGEAAHAVIRDAQKAGVLVFAGGLTAKEEMSVVAAAGSVADRPGNKAYMGGLAIVDVPSRDEALDWAARIAAACRCAQEVREVMPDAAVGN